MCNSATFNTTFPPPRKTNITLNCPYGVVETAIEFGLASNDTNICPTESKYGTIFTDPDCSFAGMGVNQTN